MKPALIAMLMLTGLCGACVNTPVSPEPVSMTLTEAIADPARSAEFRQRDGYRHPLKTLKFFGLTPTQTVVEIWPSQGWYTEILAPYLKAKGHYIAAGFVVSSDESPQWRKDMATEFSAKLKVDPGRYSAVTVTEIGLPKRWELAAPASVDVVLTFRNIHNWTAGGYDYQMFEAAAKALKPGGILGVVEHRAAPGTTLEQMKTSGYITEAYVIELANAVGLTLQARSEINANQKDTKDYPKGVWTLPPSLRLGDTDRKKYLAIGESDRMTLRFVKPLKPPSPKP